MARTAPCRTFNVLDAMILIATAAMGAYYAKILVDFKLVEPIWIVDAIQWDYSIILDVQLWNYSLIPQLNDWAEPWLLTGTLAFVALRLRKPRTSMRRLLRQSSFCALSIVVLIQSIRLLLVVIGAGVAMIQRPRPDGSSAALEAFLVF